MHPPGAFRWGRGAHTPSLIRKKTAYRRKLGRWHVNILLILFLISTPITADKLESTLERNLFFVISPTSLRLEVTTAHCKTNSIQGRIPPQPGRRLKSNAKDGIGLRTRGFSVR